MYKFITHRTTSSEFTSIFFMEINGKGFGRLYWYNNDNTTVYLDSLSVDEDSRKKGLGREIQELRENIGIETGASVAMLWVEKNTWMHDWYLRRGYKDDIKYKSKKNCIWMKKNLIF
jgi:hypothetical protein